VHYLLFFEKTTCPKGALLHNFALPLCFTKHPFFMNPTYTALDFLPILMQFGVAAAFVAFTLAMIAVLGPKRAGSVKDLSFECGIESEGNARVPYSIKYFLVAILFVLFDVEVIFLYPWAVNFKSLGLVGLVEMTIFVSFFLFGFFYIVKRGALDWE
jgi:NADH-quinone oxidoreductase subunit A